MIRREINLKLVVALLAGLLSTALPSFAAQKIWGSYENKIDGDKVSVLIRPIGIDLNGPRASIIFNLTEETGEDLEISGVGIIKGQTATLYSYRYRLTVTVSDAKADFLVEESCGDHRLYEGYGHYSKTCHLGSVKSLSKLSKGLTRRFE